ncbi:hypothetical protein Ocin01_03863 [Orchesella cincta]|uniref:Uncharacterized protein n=1 Tax=Orchesella cincta TaxID=48709 RepID=A0A1D2NC16_ORCCI|nr:hypothetical protein Ocin01_03863 [Orchesella cincta]
MALLDNETVVDLQSDEGTDPNQPLIPSSRCSSNIKKLISAGFIILLCLSFITWLAVWESEKESIQPSPTPPPFAQAPFQHKGTHCTKKPLPKNATDMAAKDLLSLVFDKDQLEYIEIRCHPQHPPTFKFMLLVENVANFTGASNTMTHAIAAVSREAAESMFGLDYSHKIPLPPPSQACQPVACTFLSC